MTLTMDLQRELTTKSTQKATVICTIELTLINIRPPWNYLCAGVLHSRGQVAFLIPPLGLCKGQLRTAVVIATTNLHIKRQYYKLHVKEYKVWELFTDRSSIVFSISMYSSHISNVLLDFNAFSKFDFFVYTANTTVRILILHIISERLFSVGNDVELIKLIMPFSCKHTPGDNEINA